MLQAGGKSKLEKQLRICRLAREMGNANTDSEAFRLAADVCCDIFPGVCSISVALMSKDGVNLHYFKLNNSNNGSHLHMGTLPAAGSASGLAMDLKLPVYTGNFENGGLDFEDWRHVHLRDGALSMISAPLIISDKALGSLNLASSLENSFDGYEDLTKCLAAILSPYLGLQKFRKELKAVEGVLHQMVPMRVALRLTELQSRVFALSQHSGAAAGVAPYPIQDPGLPPSSDEGTPDPDSSDDLIDSGSYTASMRCGPPGSSSAAGGASPAPPNPATWGGTMSHRNRVAAHSVRQRASPGAGAAGAAGDVRHRMGALFTFLDPEVERQFTREMYHRWRAHIDAGFMCLTVASLVGMGTASLLAVPWSRLVLGLLLLLAPLLATLLAVVLQPGYQRYREPLLAAARLLRVLVFVVCGAAEPVGLPGSPVGLLDAAVRSGSVIVLVQAVTGQLRMCWHVPVQWAATTLLILGTVLRDEHHPQYVFRAICMQMVVGFCVPTALLAAVEARLRHQFRTKVKTL